MTECFNFSYVLYDKRDENYLNFKDSTIRRLNEIEFEIVFDLSNMIKPRLSRSARPADRSAGVCEAGRPVCGAMTWQEGTDDPAP